ncbi:hypothetical protein PQR14_36115 [Paraburkholderia bryophila]|uniref:hypothetical protein n=1 Tax=Paraburkholderia bryophila TaxID=420952 RepID=UPI0038B870EB
MTKTKKNRYNEIRLAVETLRNEGLPINISQVSNLTGIKVSLLYTYKDLYSLMGVKPRTPKPVPVAPSRDRYITVIRDLVKDGRPMNRQDICDELQAICGSEVDQTAMMQAINSLLAMGVLVTAPNGYYRLKGSPNNGASTIQSVVMDDAGNVMIVPAGQSALSVAEQLIQSGAKKVVHFVPSEFFEPATTVVSRRI